MANSLTEYVSERIPPDFGQEDTEKLADIL
jgi:hypothetical protein